MKKPLIAFCLLLCLLAMFSTASAATKVYASFHDNDFMHGDALDSYALSRGYYDQNGELCNENSNWVIYFDGNENLTMRNAKLKSLSAESSLNIQLEGKNSIKPNNSKQTYTSHGAAVLTLGNLVFSGNGSLRIDTREMSPSDRSKVNIAIQCYGDMTINGGTIECFAGTPPTVKEPLSAGVFIFEQFTVSSGTLRAVSTSGTPFAGGLFTASNSINLNDAICECSAAFEGAPLSVDFDIYQDAGLYTFIPENSNAPCKDVKIYFSRPEDPSIITVPSVGVSASDLPQTGDRANLAVWVMMLVLSAAILLKHRKTA